MTLNIAHRGGAGLWPENTLEAFGRALALGADGFELDVQLSRDGEAVIFHDFTLKPDICRDVRGAWVERPTPRIKDLTLAELKSYDVGRLRPGTAYARAHPDQTAFDGARIPTLAELIALVRDSGRRAELWIELKTDFADRENSADPVALAHAVLDVLERHGAAADAVLVGFDWPGLIAAKARRPSLRTYFTTLPQSWFGTGEPPPAHFPPPPAQLAGLRAMAAARAPWTGGFDPHRYGSLPAAIAAAGGDGWFPFHPDLTAESAAAARAAGLKLAAWTVDEPAEMQRLLSLTIDALCTDRPDRLKDLRQGRNAAAAGA